MEHQKKFSVTDELNRLQTEAQALALNELHLTQRVAELEAGLQNTEVNLQEVRRKRSHFTGAIEVLALWQRLQAEEDAKQSQPAEVAEKDKYAGLELVK